MKHIVFHPEADAEVIAAADWYEERVRGLGSDFLDEIDAAISRISDSPETFGIVIGRVRQHLLHRFPFGVAYRVEPDRIFILAVTHLHRDPDYWKYRM